MKIFVLILFLFINFTPLLWSEENSSSNDILEVEPVMNEDNEDEELLLSEDFIDEEDKNAEEDSEETTQKKVKKSAENIKTNSKPNTEQKESEEPIKALNEDKNEIENSNEIDEFLSENNSDDKELDINKSNEPLEQANHQKNKENDDFDDEEDEFEKADETQLVEVEKENSNKIYNNQPQPISPHRVLTRKEAIEELRPKNRTRTKKIAHPDAKRGLIRITKDNVYIYKTKTPPKTHEALNVNMGSFNPTGLVNEQNVAFSDIYNTGFMIQGDKENPLLRGRLGILSWKWGTGLMVTQGNGILKSSGKEALEEFTLVMFPNQVGAIYKAQFWDTQILVPYAEGGVGYYAFMERRNDNVGNGIHKILGKLGGSPVAHYGWGLALNVMSASRSARLTLNREYGINGLWLRGELRILKGLDQGFDLSANVVNIGFTAEY